MIGVIHYAYGTPKSIDDIATYFSHILNGKTLQDQYLKKLKHHSKSLGSQILSHQLHNVKKVQTSSVKMFAPF